MAVPFCFYNPYGLLPKDSSNDFETISGSLNACNIYSNNFPINLNVVSPLTGAGTAASPLQLQNGVNPDAVFTWTTTGVTGQTGSWSQVPRDGIMDARVGPGIDAFKTFSAAFGATGYSVGDVHSVRVPSATYTYAAPDAISVPTGQTYVLYVPPGGNFILNTTISVAGNATLVLLGAGPSASLLQYGALSPIVLAVGAKLLVKSLTIQKTSSHALPFVDPTAATDSTFENVIFNPLAGTNFLGSSSAAFRLVIRDSTLISESGTASFIVASTAASNYLSLTNLTVTGTVDQNLISFRTNDTGESIVSNLLVEAQCLTGAVFSFQTVQITNFDATNLTNDADAPNLNIYYNPVAGLSQLSNVQAGRLSITGASPGLTLVAPTVSNLRLTELFWTDAAVLLDLKLSNFNVANIFNATGGGTFTGAVISSGTVISGCTLVAQYCTISGVNFASSLDIAGGINSTITGCQITTTAFIHDGANGVIMTGCHVGGILQVGDSVVLSVVNPFTLSSCTFGSTVIVSANNALITGNYFPAACEVYGNNNTTVGNRMIGSLDMHDTTPVSTNQALATGNQGTITNVANRYGNNPAP